MTCIVGLMAGDTAYLAADSARTTESGLSTVRGGSKLFTNGQYLIGVAGSIRIEELVHHVLLPPPAPAEPTEGFMVRAFIPQLRACLHDHQATLPRRENWTELVDAAFLVAVNGAIFEIGPDLQVVQLDSGIYGIGSGGAIAVGALYATTCPPPQRLQIALNAAAEFDASVRPPFYMGVSTPQDLSPVVPLNSLPTAVYPLWQGDMASQPGNASHS